MMMPALLIFLASIVATSDASLLPPAQYFTQKVDHFDGTNPSTWQQQYFVNDTFFSKDADAPILLCMGGEGPPLDGSSVVASVHCSVANNMAEELGALMLALQHRYYGCQSNMTACPVKTFDSTPAIKNPLVFLSSRQALGDMAAFHSFIVEKYGLSASNKWVTFGGSYPGMMAAWSRLKFPQLIHASISSSAPVHAKTEMKEYNDMVAYAYSVELVGGSQACADAIAKGHASILSMFASDAGRSKVASAFHLDSADWLKDKANQASFAGYGVASFPSQSNDPLCSDPACNVEKICKIMVNETYGDEVARLAQLRRVQSGAGLALTSKRAPKMMAAVDESMPDFWGYQTCTEFGFYQTCDVDSKCPFSRGLVTLNSSVAFCLAEYNLTLADVAANVKYSDVYYGGNRPSGSRVFWVNGQIDPWGALSVLSPLDGQPTLMVPGASHHAWTHPFDSRDSKYLTQARDLIFAQVVEWLAEE